MKQLKLDGHIFVSIATFSLFLLLSRKIQLFESLIFMNFPCDFAYRTFLFYSFNGNPAIRNLPDIDYRMILIALESEDPLILHAARISHHAIVGC
jgi:hypothetical protein